MELTKHLKLFNKIKSNKILCSACHQPIRKHIIKCSGPCERNFHQKCVTYDEISILKPDSRKKYQRSSINLCEMCEHAEQNLMMRLSSLNQHLEELKTLDVEINKLMH